MNRHAKVAVAFLFGATSVIKAATINYVGPGTDLADPDNWSGAWTSADTLVISTNNFAFPAEGFTLSGDLPASAKIQMTKFPASTVKVDCGGHSLNTTVLDFGLLHTTDAEKFNPVLMSGGFGGVTRIENSDNRGCVHLTNGTFTVANGFKFARWLDYLHILKGAELVITDINGAATCGFLSSANSSILDINGGRLHITGRSGSADHIQHWRMISWQFTGSYPGILKIRNGGEYVDDTPAPADWFKNCSVLIDGGSYIATNGTSQALVNTLWGASSRSFALTNGTLKIGQFGTGKSDVNWFNCAGALPDPGFAANTRITFHNSQEIFARKYVSAATWNDRKVNSSDGMFFVSVAKLNTLRISGAENVYRSGWFVLGGQTNTVEIADGSFSVTNRFCAYDGYGSIVRFTGGTSDIESFHVADGATNFTVEVSGDAAVNVAELTLARQTKFKFAISGDGFATAPVKCGATAANGNFRFEFDASGFTWPESLAKIPLISDEGGFDGWGEGGTALDINALNAEYADALPVGVRGVKSRFKLDDGGKTLSLVMPKGIIIAIF